MANNSNDLKVYSFTEEDINLITFAVRRLKDQTGLKSTKNDCSNLLEYIERLKEEHKKS